MSIFAVLFFCFQACLVQNVFSQCLGAGPLANGLGLGYGAGLGPYAAGLGQVEALAGPYGAGLGLGVGPALVPELVAPGVSPFGLDALAGAYGGAGIGDIAVAGEMPVAGTTLVAGQVPILGAVRFAGDLPAAGTVSIAGSCGCGAGAYLY
ncbi:chorion protein [Danaus plexippus plexippus]|uniref:Chorion protein n=1 Tax=Danaus plexippus plexippus TaxID=278856 RepID=A0A212FL86_DANPL|nr:chorion protein [Danaus plexippus plexippus]